MRVVWLAVCVFLAVLGELLAGNLGVPLPVLACTVFYVTVLTGMDGALPAGLLAATVLDLVLIRACPVTAVIVVAVCGLARLWRRHGDCRHPLAQVFPGAFVGVVCAASGVVMTRFAIERFGWAMLWRDLWLAAWLTAAGALLLPLVCRALDAAAVRLGMVPYSRIQDVHDGVRVRP